MPKKSDKRTDSISEEEETDELQTLIEQVDQEQQRLEEKREQENPDGRLTGYQLVNMYIAITDKNPFTGEIERDENGQVIGFGLSYRDYKEAKLFKTKLHDNLKKIREALTVLNGVIPSLDEEQSKKIEKYHEKHRELLKENAGVEDLSNFTDDELQTLIKNQKNKKIYDNAKEELDKEYEEVLDANEEISDERHEWLQKPLLKCDFDMITKNDVSKSPLKVYELDAIDPMLNY